MNQPTVRPTHRPWQRALALALAALLTSGPVGARGPGRPGIAELEDIDDRLPPAGAKLAPGITVGVEDTVTVPNDPASGISINLAVSADAIAGAPSTMTLGRPVTSATDELLVPLMGVTADAMIDGRPAQPAVSLVLGAALIPPLKSLKTVEIPPVRGLENFIRDYKAAIVLGKALFWDVQVGSDGQACASCHFHAGADNRMKNQLNPGLAGGDAAFQRTATGGGGPNYTLKPADFPFYRLANIMDRNSAILFESNDVVSSQGTFGGPLLVTGGTNAPSVAVNSQAQPEAMDKCGNRAVDSFSVHGMLTRRVAGRNAPTTINAVFNFRNFWDGRANNVFNGVNPFGNRDPGATVLQRQADGQARPVTVALRNASLASQAVGPAMSDFEMSCAGKTFKYLGKKMLAKQPLAQQIVDKTDSVLGPYRHASAQGLNKTYVELIKQAFDAQWWSAPGSFDGFSQMESNFSLFWGLAIMAYESTLVSDEAPVDRFVGWAGSPPDLKALSAREKHGLEIFRGKGLCFSCHKGAEFTSAATSMLPVDGEPRFVEHMFVGAGRLGVYDNGFYNIGVRPSSEDLGVGGSDPFGNPLSFSRLYLSQVRGNGVADPIWVDPCSFAVKVDAFSCWTPPDPNMTRVGVDGAFKTPSLRNIALTSPYFHNGGRLTLEQVVEFYDRGGDRRGPDGNDTSGFTGPGATNGGNSNVHPNIRPLGMSAEERADLVAFLRHALTDRRVACESAPFDHPSLRIFNGHVGDRLTTVDQNRDGRADDETVLLPAVGAAGLPPGQCLRNDDGSLVKL